MKLSAEKRPNLTACNCTWLDELACRIVCMNRAFRRNLAVYSQQSCLNGTERNMTAISLCSTRCTATSSSKRLRVKCRQDQGGIYQTSSLKYRFNTICVLTAASSSLSQPNVHFQFNSWIWLICIEVAQRMQGQKELSVTYVCAYLFSVTSFRCTETTTRR